MNFVANFIRFPAVQKFWKSVKIWQSYREFKGVNFFWDSVVYNCVSVYVQASSVLPSITTDGVVSVKIGGTRGFVSQQKQRDGDRSMHQWRKGISIVMTTHIIYVLWSASFGSWGIK